MLFLFLESYTYSYQYNYTYILSIIAVVFAISVIITKNPVYSILFLIGLFGTIALYLMVLGMNFLGISYLLVYVGAISILFLFILMLINIRVSELLTEGRNSIPLAITTILLINFSLESILPYSNQVVNIYSNLLNDMTKFFSFFSIFLNITTLNITNNIELQPSIISGKSWDTTLIDNTHIASIGNIMYGDLLIFLIVISMILLLAMVGSIIITIKK